PPRSTLVPDTTLFRSQVTPAQRRAAKAVNFGLVYGQTDFGLARSLGISRAEAAGYIEAYFKRYPGVKEYMERVVAEARQRGYVTDRKSTRLNSSHVKN